MSPQLIEMGNGLPPKRRVEVKSGWIATMDMLLRPFLEDEWEPDRRDDAPEISVVLAKR